MNFLIIYDNIFVMIKHYKICSVFGHRKIEVSKELKRELFSLFDNLIKNENVDCFLFGGLGEFDDFCYKIISNLKRKYPNIKRVFCCYDPKFQDERKRPNWLKNQDYGEIIFLNLDFDFWYSRIFFRNCEMINLSDFVVFYVKTKEKSGAFKTLSYAKKLKKTIFNVCTTS